jgi:hypothetical protein
MIDIIRDHFDGSYGPYWINGYKLQDKKFKRLKVLIGKPFNLRNLAASLETLGWISDPSSKSIHKDTPIATLILQNSHDVITGVSINKVDEYGENIPYNYLIPLHTIDRVECHNFPSDAKILVKHALESCTGITGLTGCSGCTGYSFIDLACVMPIIPPPINFENELCNLGDCTTLLCSMTGINDGTTGCGICYEMFFNGLTGPTAPTGFCEGQAYYTNCVRITETDIGKLRDIFGTSEQLQIIGYRIVSDEVEGDNCPLITPQNIGIINPTLTDLANALIALGWTENVVMPTYIELTLQTCKNIKYISILNAGGNPELPPYPYLIGANCIEENICPSTNTGNYILIRKPDCQLCWASICVVKGLMGDQGITGPMGNTAMGGITGSTGPPGAMGIIGSQGSQGFQGFQGPQGTQGATGPQGRSAAGPGPQGAIGSQGAHGVQGQAGATGQMGIPAAALGPQGAQGTPATQGPVGVKGSTGPAGSALSTGPQGSQGSQGVQNIIGPRGPQGTQGSQATVTGINGAQGVQIFKNVTTGNNFNFRTIIAGQNILVTELGNTINVAVDTSFDWSNTIFSGGITGADDAAIVTGTSSLTFATGAILNTDDIEETFPGHGVTIEGVNFNDGGVEFGNILSMGTFGLTPNPLYLEYYEYGQITTGGFTQWVYNNPSGNKRVGKNIVSYERIGNRVTLYIPTIDLTQGASPSGNTGNPSTPSAGNSLIFMQPDLPASLSSPFTQLLHVTYNDASIGTNYVNSMLNISGISVFISQDLSGAGGFTSGSNFFSENLPRAYSYYVSNNSGPTGFSPP